jgi:hypothetical protein
MEVAFFWSGETFSIQTGKVDGFFTSSAQRLRSLRFQL